MRGLGLTNCDGGFGCAKRGSRLVSARRRSWGVLKSAGMEDIWLIIVIWSLESLEFNGKVTMRFVCVVEGEDDEEEKERRGDTYLPPTPIMWLDQFLMKRFTLRLRWPRPIETQALFYVYKALRRVSWSVSISWSGNGLDTEKTPEISVRRTSAVVLPL